MSQYYNTKKSIKDEMNSLIKEAKIKKRVIDISKMFNEFLFKYSFSRKGLYNILRELYQFDRTIRIDPLKEELWVDDSEIRGKDINEEYFKYGHYTTDKSSSIHDTKDE